MHPSGWSTPQPRDEACAMEYIEDGPDDKATVMPQLILASTSPWRRQILCSAGLDVSCVPPLVDETEVDLDDPIALVRELARRKALAVAGRHPEAWVIGADQVVFDPEQPQRIWGKPPHPEEHLRRLLAMRGRWHALVTGVVIWTPREELAVVHEQTRLLVRSDLEDVELSRYVDTGEGSGCAGGYAAEGLGGFLFERIEGDWFNVLGLPLFRVLDVLRARGWRFGVDA